MSYILFFDSGLGGLSVLREALRLHPEENYIYLADNANIPYGDKDTDTLRRLTVEAIENIFKKYPVKAITVACNTATSAAISDLRKIYSGVPVIGIEPALKPAAERHPGGRIGVMATMTTLRERKFRDLLARFADDALITPIPCPGLVDFVERGILDGDELKSFLEGIFKKYDAPFDALVLGCTHYPFVKNAIKEVSGCEDIIDGAYGTVNNLFRRLDIKMNDDENKNKGELIFINTACKEDFESAALELLNSDR